MAIEIDIHSKDMEVDDRLYSYITKRAARVERYIKGVRDLRIDLSFIKSARDANDRQVAEITLRGKGFILRAEERTDDIYSAFDIALDKLQRRIARYKGKHYKGHGDRATVREGPLEEGADITEAADSEKEIVRRKMFTLKPMDEQEAIEQMNLLGHEDFFVFFNVNTDSVNVLYRRRNDSYGLIGTEIA